MRLTGSQRIGVVVSVIWLALVTALAGMDFYAVIEHKWPELERAHSFFYWESRIDIDPMKTIVDPFASTEAQELAKHERIRMEDALTLRMKWVPLVTIMVLPILVSWLLAYLVRVTYIWVRAGFRDSE
jgi:hypothetical protein